MDDPWGSPWASTDTPTDTDASPSSRADNFLSPPPKAFFGNGTSLSPLSPWAGSHDDGGFGVWTAAGRADDADSQNEWGTWAESAVQRPRLSPRLSSSGKDSPLAWPENAAASPVLTANARSRTPSILRYHSPDPWATELSLTNGSNITLPNSSNTTNGEVLSIEIAQSGEDSQVSLAVTGTEDISVEGDFTVRQGGYPTSSHGPVGKHTDTSSQLESTAFDIPSRPSSACTIDSLDGPERQDSPITSIDEDRGARMRNSLRNTSGKVQVLVGKYDGLARAASEEPPTFSQGGLSQSASREESLARSVSEDDDNDQELGFGNLVGALADGDGVAQSPSKFSSESSSTPQAESQGVLAPKSEYEGEEDRVNTSETGPVRSANPPNQFQDIKFELNLSSVDKLFSGLRDSPASCSAEDWEVPNHVMDDSFTTTSERKAWYRLSRYGSMRKHNSGDDENYHGVTWSTSQLHSDTIKIVRRWMEEDMYAGKATFGGTKRTGFFDWDSDAAPVELDQVFRRRKSLRQHTRTTSIPAGSAIQTRPTGERPYRNSTGISFPAELQLPDQPILAVPGFNWNTGTKEIPFRTRFSSGETPNAVPVLAPVRTESLHEDDDDDWGEMVASPCDTKDHVEPIFPLSETSSNNHEPKSRPGPTLPDVNQSTGPKIPTTTTTETSPWSFTDVMALDKSNGVPESPAGLPPETRGKSSVLEANTALPHKVSIKSPNQKSTMENETSGEELTTSRVAFGRDVNEVTTTPIPLQHFESQDDIIVQSILKHLPDMSYMLR
ncbi:hypothetical protein F5Y03DRAFT_204882 [Xylaria venustula]|nr:hypothetical protein F5Y03DRAFT_204882 [Xylaria venustula]